MNPSKIIVTILFPSVTVNLVSALLVFATESLTTKPPSFNLSDSETSTFSYASVVV